MKKSKRNILISGAYGFVGVNLAKGLAGEASCKLFALDVVEQNKNLYHMYYSWKDLNAIPWNSLDAIIHLAGIAHDVQNIADPNSYFEINYGLTKVIFERFLSSKATQFIFFSSVKAAADTVESTVLTENVLPDPKTPYGLSKLQAEKYILSQKLPMGKQAIILRPCMIHGPGNKGNLNLLFQVIRKGIPYPLGSFHNERSFTSIENVIFIIKQVINKGIESGVYNICDDESISTNELILLIAKSCYRKPHILNIPAPLIKKIASLGDLLHFPLNSERLKKLTESYIVSNDKLKCALGIQHLPVSVHDGLAYTLRSFSVQ